MIVIGIGYRYSIIWVLRDYNKGCHDIQCYPRLECVIIAIKDKEGIRFVNFSLM